MHERMQQFVPEPDDDAAAVLCDGPERPLGDRLRRERRDPPEPAVRGDVLLDVLPRGNAAGKHDGDFGAALPLRSQRDPELFERLFGRAVQGKIGHGRTGRHASDCKQFAHGLLASAHEHAVRKGHRALQVDARLHDKFFFRICLERLLRIDPRHVDKAGKAHALPVRKGKERRTLCAVRKIAGTVQDGKAGKLRVQCVGKRCKAFLAAAR